MALAGSFEFDIFLSHSAKDKAVLCMSANAFGSDWAQLACPAEASERRRKAGTFGRGRCRSRNLRSRATLKKECSFIRLPHTSHADQLVKTCRDAFN